jgi:hypothetical protein
MRPACVSRCGWPHHDEGPLVAALRSLAQRSCYGQLDVRVTVFDVIGMPGIVGVLSESADVPVAVAE